MSDERVYEPQIRARLGTTALGCTLKKRDAAIHLRLATKEPPEIVTVLAYGIEKEAVVGGSAEI